MSAPSGLDFPLLLADFQGEFLASIPDADPAAIVPACGDWTVRELVEHLAFVHHWAAANARARKATRLGDGPFDLAGHYAACAAELREAFAELDPAATARILAYPDPMGEGPVSFWHRRQVHETLVHGHDLRAAIVGKAALGLIRAVPEVWADAVDEVVSVFYPRQVGTGRRQPLPAPFAVVATDVDPARGWVLGGAGHDIDEVPLRVSGAAEGLALLLWGRITVDEAGLTVDGSRADLDVLLREPVVP
ncbi:maleylpyruvate isomerase family mycothiol-dependent enzyme [Nocardia speluncae]|uniref:Maleylpyruvate isomerase family mycothiol-dependent enzyme n=1 Tax=Nocardia speluncae TaxID=419477 RepID=A0A846XHL6_9NOCA|nr:maleylpyruvate isomerase family mycothiol-dependent enzyme [Nocardia speluncae]NKY33354.1 maleylpyruvate isomerase family mycothiol-dependent enzyme [Nocardia speluncae]